jgi:predicted MFS family arabinose efflux permease
MGLTALSLAILTFLDIVQPAHLYALAFVLGLATAVDNPTRQSFVVELVGVARLANAIGLNSATFNVSRLVGPAIGGALLLLFGPGWSFVVNTLSFVAVIGAIASLKADQLYQHTPQGRERGQVREGFRFILHDGQLLVILAVTFCAGTLATNWPVMLTLMARLVYGSGPQACGTMFTAIAIGSLIGSLLAAARASTRLAYILGGAGALGIAEVALAFSPTYKLFILGLVPLGLVALTLNTSSNSRVQTLVPDHMRGRIMSVCLIASSGGTPLGAPLQGWIAEEFGARVSFVVGGAAMITAAAAGTVVLVRGSRRASRARLAV